ncbi:hypothetical protein PNF31_26470 [Priestia megaterium]|uniref:hypothetical protein n=1 Tax=Priestia megaterium TaxID=1404 RepID=UPI00234E7F63|nr:hypothetical protein [Priestia megaterium]MDC7724273.1 hypothetical protein [Priestia megaterium]
MSLTNYIWNGLQNLKLKDVITFGGILATSFISLRTLKYTKKNNNKSLYVNSITKERIASMGEFKEQVARYLSIISKYKLMKDKNENEIEGFIQDIEYRTMRIAFQLNPNSIEEEKLYNQLKKINSLIKYNLFYTNNENEKLYPTKLLNLIDDYRIEVSNFYNDYSEEKLIYSSLHINKKILSEFEKNFSKFLNKLVEQLSKDIRNHLKEEWSKIKNENEDSI